MRRAHDALKLPQYYIDKETGEPMQPHRVNPLTGMFKGRQIIDAERAE